MKSTFDDDYQGKSTLKLKCLYGDEAPSYSTVKNWFNEFNRGRRSLKDEFREGHCDREHEIII